ncbi:DsbA family oxidoreductase [Chitinophaga niabensis]|uniref:Predicted dithiol-disulfide isomerase, DsbA family n=1 Tax=Chitinophaga niabensis TaxID=536979 RepID=A0A1N6DHC9_9BACT|nr:DsbA family oxidoreductase [Chitinophaga niabensis]SIN70083.1 Predicted dithiol-disulfide isomerase, DsbA family [Chitinophaga niabensis]
MKIDIWSDVACPFCYIGKRHLEAALEQFPHKNEVEVTWHNFELDPNASRDNKEDQYTLLARKYGMSREQAIENTDRVAASGEKAGLAFEFDKVIPTNTFDAHRLIQFAAQHGKQDEMEERLFSAYFMEGKHISNKETLLAIAKDLGLDATEVLNSDAYTKEVRKDEADAQSLGIRGVPFFVFDMKYAVSGAQPVDAFTQTLQKVWEETHPPVELIRTGDKGETCEDGSCTV